MEIETIHEIINSAKQAWEKGDYKRAITHFQTAQQYYLEQNDPLNAAEMANNLSVALLQAGKKKQALEAVQGTAEIFATHNDRKRQAMALGNEAAVQEALKQYQTALALYQESAEIFKELGEKELASHIQKSIALIQVRTGKQLEGILAMQHSLDNIKKPTLWQRFYRWLLKFPFKLTGN